MAREWTALSPVRGMVIGAVTGIVWWHLAGQEHRARPSVT
jgi:hypothetical protein